MDQRQFDQLARVVANGTSRRRVLGILGAGVAALGTHFTGRSAEAGCLEYGADCSQGACCPGFECDGGYCDYVCANVGESCGFVPTGGGPEIVCCTGFCNQQGVCEEEVPTCGGEGDLCFAREAGREFNCCQDGLECIDGTCQFPEPQCPGEGEYCGPKSLECCADGLQCIDDTCTVPEPICAEIGESCGQLDGFVQVDCCDSLVCLAGICEEPEPKCFDEGGICADSSECCDDLVCLDSGLCGTEPVPTCIDEGDACEVDSDCCDGICCAGFCRDIECCIDDPDPNDRCDDGQSCFEGICEGVSEFCEDDSTCGAGTCCCDDGSCSEDCCDPPVEEKPVTQLPNTGIGDAPSGRTGWIGAAALGAAAAFFGSKKLAPDEQAKPVTNDD